MDLQPALLRHVSPATQRSWRRHVAAFRWSIPVLVVAECVLASLPYMGWTVWRTEEGVALSAALMFGAIAVWLLVAYAALSAFAFRFDEDLQACLRSERDGAAGALSPNPARSAKHNGEFEDEFGPATHSTATITPTETTEVE